MAEMISEQVSSLPPQFAQQHQQQQQLPGKEEKISNASRCEERYAEIIAWVFQMCASVSWIISVVIYDSWEDGDIFHMLAASAWTVSNLLSVPYNGSFSSDGVSQTDKAPSSSDNLELVVVNSV